MPKTLREWANRRALERLGEHDVETVEAPEAEGENRILPPAFGPDGRPIPRFRAFVADIAPPAPSAGYRRDPTYAARLDVVPASQRRANSNYQAWHERHSQATNQVTGWLASAGGLGAEARAAHIANQRTGEARRAARQAVEAARTAHAEAERRLGEAATSYLHTERGPVPTGTEAVTCRLGVEAAELAAEAVEAACRQAQQRWGQAVIGADWSGALGQAELLNGAEADTAAAWLRAKVHPPATPAEDPLAWI